MSYGKDDDWLEYPDESEFSSDHGGPFAIPPVDPLVYRPVVDNDSPELRAAAAAVVPTQRLQIKDARPVKPPGRSFMRWVPGWNRSTADEMEGPEAKSWLPAPIGWVIVGVLCVIPIVLGWLIISFALNFYNN